MGFVRTAFGLLSLTLLLSGCNTTDALTPQVDVGGGHIAASGPVTERDLQQMAQSQQPVYPPRSQIAQGSGGLAYDRQALSPLPPTGFQSTTGARPGPGAPPRTLGQQAASLGAGQADPSPSRAAAGDEADGPATDSPTAEPPIQKASVAPEGDDQPATGQQTIRFLPIIGAPLTAVTPLSRQLGAEARHRGITIKSSGDAAAKHVLKGYFSAVSGGGTVTVTYVWDVLDSSGGRLNRIQGQESFPANARDPWPAVPASVMQNIATKTMDSYTRWADGP